MDKEDCIQLLLSTLQKPQWKCSNSVTDWDLKNIIWRAGYLLSPDQADALLADVKRRGLIVSRERRGFPHHSGTWGVRIACAGDDWLVQRAMAGTNAPCHRKTPAPDGTAEMRPDNQKSCQEEPVEVGLQ
jgi:hypothetical protein